MLLTGEAQAHFANLDSFETVSARNSKKITKHVTHVDVRCVLALLTSMFFPGPSPSVT